jgi:hypothetical protein
MVREKSAAPAAMKRAATIKFAILIMNNGARCWEKKRLLAVDETRERGSSSGD